MYGLLIIHSFLPFHCRLLEALIIEKMVTESASQCTVYFSRQLQEAPAIEEIVVIPASFCLVSRSENAVFLIILYVINWLVVI